MLGIIDEKLNIGNISKGEEGEYLAGKCLCLGAIILSRLLDKYPSEISTILERLVKLATQRSYLRIIAHEYIVTYIHSVSPTCPRDFK